MIAKIFRKLFGVEPGSTVDTKTTPPSQPAGPRNLLMEKLMSRVDSDPRYHHGQTFQKPSQLSDHKPVWSTERGNDYLSFWTNVAETKDGALMVTRAQLVDDETDAFLIQDVAEMIAEGLELNRESKVLEVGSGIGSLAVHLAPEVREYALADISPSMLAHAKSRLKGVDGTSFHQLEKCDLSIFSDNLFDAVFFEAVLIHMDKEDSYRYMRETFRVLKPGGRAYFQFYNLLHPAGLQRFLYLVDNMCDGAGRNVVSRPRLHVGSEIRQYLGQIGFRVDEQRSQLCDGIPDVYKHIDEDALIAFCSKP